MLPKLFYYLLLLLQLVNRARSRIEEEDDDDVGINRTWVLTPKSQDADATHILNSLLGGYDSKLRPDVGIKPIVIDVDIYVNSIGPVSVIQMLQGTVHQCHNLQEEAISQHDGPEFDAPVPPS